MLQNNQFQFLFVVTSNLCKTLLNSSRFQFLFVVTDVHGVATSVTIAFQFLFVVTWKLMVSMIQWYIVLVSFCCYFSNAKSNIIRQLFQFLFVVTTLPSSAVQAFSCFSFFLLLHVLTNIVGELELSFQFLFVVTPLPLEPLI